jgi:transposase
MEGFFVEKMYVGLDVHKETISMAVVDSQGKVMKEAKFLNSLQSLDRFLSGMPSGTEFALEACGFYEPIYDWIDDRGYSVTLAHPLKVKAIASAKIKTDTIDARTLAQLKRVDLLPASFVPPKHVREVRSIVRHRASMVRQRSHIKHCVHAVLHREGIKQPFSDLFGKAGIEWLKKVPLKLCDRFSVDNYLAIHNAMSEKIGLVSIQIDGLVNANPNVARLTTMPGIGTYSALLIATEIGDVHRFPSADKLCAYAGLVPSVYQSARTVRRGHITKEGNRLLRWILVEAAQKAGEHDAHLSRIYNRLKSRLGKNKAKVAIARKMLCYIFVMLTKGKKYTDIETIKPESKKMLGHARVSHVPLVMPNSMPCTSV